MLLNIPNNYKIFEELYNIISGHRDEFIQCINNQYRKLILPNANISKYFNNILPKKYDKTHKRIINDIGDTNKKYYIAHIKLGKYLNKQDGKKSYKTKYLKYKMKYLKLKYN